MGWYHTTYDYRDGLGLQDETSQQFGTHVGGGLNIPLVPTIASLDLNARYVKLGDKESAIAPAGIEQSFWSTAVGIAIKF